MRPLFDDAEKHHLAAGEPLLGSDAIAENAGNVGRCQHHGAWFTAVELDDEVLVTPDRDEEAIGIGDTLDDPAGVAATQAGAFEVGMGVEIWRSHPGRLAQPPSLPQPASPHRAARRRSR